MDTLFPCPAIGCPSHLSWVWLLSHSLRRARNWRDTQEQRGFLASTFIHAMMEGGGECRHLSNEGLPPTSRPHEAAQRVLNAEHDAKATQLAAGNGSEFIQAVRLLHS